MTNVTNIENRRIISEAIDREFGQGSYEKIECDVEAVSGLVTFVMKKKPSIEPIFIYKTVYPKGQYHANLSRS